MNPSTFESLQASYVMEMCRKDNKIRNLESELRKISLCLGEAVTRLIKARLELEEKLSQMDAEKK